MDRITFKDKVASKAYIAIVKAIKDSPFGDSVKLPFVDGMDTMELPNVPAGWEVDLYDMICEDFNGVYGDTYFEA